jgi:hypothetical protein
MIGDRAIAFGDWGIWRLPIGRLADFAMGGLGDWATGLRDFRDGGDTSITQLPTTQCNCSIAQSPNYPMRTVGASPHAVTAPVIATA